MHSRECTRSKAWNIIKFTLFNTHVILLFVIAIMSLFSALILKETYSALPCVFLFLLFISVIAIRLVLSFLRNKDGKEYQNNFSSVLFRSIELISVIITCGSLLLTLIYTLVATMNGHITSTDEISSFLALKVNEFLLMAPAGLVYFYNLVELVSYLKNRKKGIFDNISSLDTLARAERVVVVGLEAFKTKNKEVAGVLPLTNISEDEINQIISNVIEYTKKENQYDSLNEYFRCFTKFDIISSIKFNDENKFGAVTFATGMTYLFGSPYQMNIENKNVYQKINELTEKGYKVLTLAKGLEQIADDSYTAPVTAIALVLLKDELQEGLSETFEYLSSRGVDVKVLSASSIENTQFVLRNAGFMNTSKAYSSSDDLTKFADEGALFCDLDVEKATNFMLYLNEQNIPTAYVSEDFNKTTQKIEEGLAINNRMKAISTLYLSKSIFAILASLIFWLISLFTSYSYEYPFAYNNFLLVEVFSIMLPSFYLLTESSQNPLKKSFLLDVLKNCLPIVIMLVFGVTLSFVLYLFHINGIIYTGVEEYGYLVTSNNVNRYGATAVAVLTVSILFYVSLYLSIRKAYKKSVSLVAFTVIPSILIVAMMLLVGPTTNWMQIDFSKILPVNYLAIGAISVIIAAIVVLVIILKETFGGNEKK